MASGKRRRPEEPNDDLNHSIPRVPHAQEHVRISRSDIANMDVNSPVLQKAKFTVGDLYSRKESLDARDIRLGQRRQQLELDNIKIQADVVSIRDLRRVQTERKEIAEAFGNVWAKVWEIADASRNSEQTKHQRTSELCNEVEALPNFTVELTRLDILIAEKEKCVESIDVPKTEERTLELDEQAMELEDEERDVNEIWKAWHTDWHLR